MRMEVPTLNSRGIVFQPFAVASTNLLQTSVTSEATRLSAHLIVRLYERRMALKSVFNPHIGKYN